FVGSVRFVYETARVWHEKFSRQVAEELKALSPKNVLEVGTGEATSLCDIALYLGNEISFSGLELSLSRILYAQRFSKYKNVDINFAMGDMFSLPYPDNSFDVILLIHCLESNTGREKDALKELIRVVAGNGYIVMLEPSYELGNEETRKRIKRLCYIDSLTEAIEDCDLDIIKHELFRVTTYNNNTGLTIIKKGAGLRSVERIPAYICPNCQTMLHKHDEAYFCPECYNLYPVIHNIPILNKNHAILCSKYETEEAIF
ncbi:MAG: class I SAM-dependent methyltransferase, partial [Lachnospiraceae bacterium]|nr:class I SAM-dependent methyltransferase [Lachnospiraceae bacterium]